MLLPKSYVMSLRGNFPADQNHSAKVWSS